MDFNENLPSVYVCEDETLMKKVMHSLQSLGLIHDFGIETSLTNSGQQW